MIRLGRVAAILIVGATFASPIHMAAQDPIQLGIRYQPGVRPGIIVAAGPGLDSVRTIIERDLQFSDRFQMAFWPQGAGPLTGPLNRQLYRETLGLTWAVELQPVAGGARVMLHHLPSGETRIDGVRGLDPSGVGTTRMSLHALSDEIVRAATGGIGIAATRILFEYNDAIWSIDSDGAGLRQVSRGIGLPMSPDWSPDGNRIAFTELRDAIGPVVIQSLNSGSRQTVPGTSGAGNSITPVFSPNGQEMVFALSGENGTDLHRVDIARMCCVLKLTASGKLADNLNPTYSPDGRRIAFESTRAGRNQIYVMDADGANQRALVPGGPDIGSSFSPDWSPDGDKIAFHRDVGGGGRQVLVYEFGTGRATVVTGTGRNEDPSWSPDSRHLVFRSSRGGSQQLWVLDTETATLRQLTNVNGPARLPSWSPSFAGQNP